MKKSKQTKRALIPSLFAVILCVAMLVGTTFAWFTDTASTSVNKIEAGTLDVTLKMNTGTTDNPTWVSAEGETLKFKKATDGATQEVLWEPGCTYELPQIKIVNNGNLALKYKVLFTAVDTTDEDLELAKVLDVTMNNVTAGTLYDVLTSTDEDGYAHGTLAGGKETDPITLKVTMQTTAGNEYQGESISGIAITVLATQDTVEYDSTTNKYDKDATYPTTVKNATGLKDALANGENVFLSSDIVLTEPLTIKNDVEIIGNGYSVISNQPVSVNSTANVTMKDVNFATPTNSSSNASSVYASNFEGKVVFDGCTFTNPQWECIQITPKDGAEIIVTNCTFIVDGNGTYAHNDKVERMLHVQNVNANGNYTITVTNNKFIGVDKVRNSVIDIDDIAAFENVTCGGNTFFNHNNEAVSSLADAMIYVNLAFKYDDANVATETYTQFIQTPPAALYH